LESKSLKERRKPLDKLKMTVFSLNKTSTIALLLFVCLAIGCADSTTKSQSSDGVGTEKRIASADVVKVSPEPVVIGAGASADATIRLNIQSGYHVNANPPSFPYLKATELQIPATDGVSVGFIAYPDPLKKRFEFNDEELAVYEGATILKVNLKADKGTKIGRRELPAKLQVQACDDKVCYAPGVINFSIPVDVK
jgi:hypothetical protein